MAEEEQRNGKIPGVEQATAAHAPAEPVLEPAIVITFEPPYGMPHVSCRNGAMQSTLLLSGASYLKMLGELLLHEGIAEQLAQKVREQAPRVQPVRGVVR